MDEVRAEDLVQKIGQPRKDRAVLVAGVDNLTPLGKVTPVTVDDDGNLHVRADKLEEKLEELLGERQQNPAAWSIADRLRRLEEKLALLESGQAKVTLSGRNAVLTKVFNAYQIRDNAYNHIQTVDISGYKRIDVYAQHTHDQPTRVRILPVSFMNFVAWNGTDFASNYWEVDMTFTNRRYVITSRFPEIRELASQNIIIQVYCVTAPTTGSVTVELVGIPN